MASDISLAVDGDARRMTYTELAAVQGTSQPSAERLVRRRGWPPWSRSRSEAAPGAISKGVLMKELCDAIIGGVLLGALVIAPALLAIWEERAAPGHRSSANSCRQLDSVERKCVYGSCDQWMIERLTKECLRASGQWGEQP